MVAFGKRAPTNGAARPSPRPIPTALRLGVVLLLILAAFCPVSVSATLTQQDQAFIIDFYHATENSIIPLKWDLTDIANACNTAKADIWEGITCFQVDQTSFENIISLRLPNRGLYGQIPPSISNLPNLLSLDLSHNQLFGYLPADFEKLSFLDLNLMHNYLQCQEVAPASMLSTSRMATCEVSGNQFCTATNEPNTLFTNCAQLFPALCRTTYCRVEPYGAVPASGLRVAAAGDQTATFVASGKIPEVGIVVESASATAACNLTVLQILQTATQLGSDIDLGTAVLTQRVLDLSTLTWSAQWNNSKIGGNPTTDVHYEASILNGFGKVIIHATMLNAGNTFTLYDGVFDTDPLSVKLSVEVYNWNRTEWTQTITGEYLAATLKLTCKDTFKITETSSNAPTFFHTDLALNFITKGNLAGGRLRNILQGSFDDQKTDNVMFGYLDSADKTAATTDPGVTSLTYRMHVANAKNNMWFDPDLMLFATNPPSYVPPPKAPPPQATPISPPSGGGVGAPPTNPGAGNPPTGPPIPAGSPVVAGSPSSGYTAPSESSTSAPVATPPPQTVLIITPPEEPLPPTADNAVKPGLSGSNIALIIFGVVLVVLIVVIIIAVKWPKIRASCARKSDSSPPASPAQTPLRTAQIPPASPSTFAPPQSLTQQQPAMAPPNNPSGWSQVRKSRLGLTNTQDQL